MGIVAAGSEDRAAFTELLLSGASALKGGEGRVDSVQLDPTELRVPPRDLEQTLPQQHLILEAALQAMEEVGAVPSETTGVFVGMGADAEISRYGLRWRLRHLEDRPGLPWLDSWLDSAKDSVIGSLQAAGVLGTMPNIPSNRLNRHFNLGGASCTVSEEERSGLRATAVAVSALQGGELDAALVGAVDLSCEPVHREAAAGLLRADQQIPGDAAVALVLMRLPDAQAAGHRIYARITNAPEGGLRLGLDEGTLSLGERFGHAHAASGLLHLAAAAISLHHRQRPDGVPWLAPAPRRATVKASSLGRSGASVVLGEHTAGSRVPERDLPRFFVYSGAHPEELKARVAADQRDEERSGSGPCRLVIVAASASELRVRAERAGALIDRNHPGGMGIHYRAAPVVGETAFVFTAAGAAYPSMSRDLLAAFPELGARLLRRFSGLPESLEWAFGGHPATPTQMLWGASSLCQLHAELTRHELGLHPSAAIGYSSGESNAFFAFDVWQDMDAMAAELDASQLFTRDIGGRFEAVRRRWGREPEWAVWSLLAPIERVRELVSREPHVHLSIVHTADDSVIAGDASAATASSRSWGGTTAAASTTTSPFTFPSWPTCPSPGSVHRREVQAPPGIRFYSGATHRPIDVTTEGCARAILDQAVAPLDFPATVEQAWNDGVRVFVEHGPQAACGGFISQVLGERRSEAAIVSLDRRGRGILPIYDAVAELMAAGIDVDPSFLLRPPPEDGRRGRGRCGSRRTGRRSSCRSVRRHPRARWTRSTRTCARRCRTRRSFSRCPLHPTGRGSRWRRWRPAGPSRGWRPSSRPTDQPSRPYR